MESIRASSVRLAMPIMSYPGLAFTNGSVEEVTTSAKAQFDCVYAVNTAYPTIAALAPMDLSVEAEAFGCRVAFHPGDIPAVTAPCIHTPADQDALPEPAVGAARTAVYLESVERLSKHFGDRPTFAGMIGPFSLAVRLRDMSEILIDLMVDPERVSDLLDRCVTFLTAYVKAFKSRGASGVIVAEPAAGLLAPQQCEQFSSQYVKRMVDAVQDEQFIVILHNCGQVTRSISSMVATGARCIHVGNVVDVTDVLAQVPASVLVFGNIDPAGLFRNGTADRVYSATTDLLRRTRDHRNYVLSSGCDVPPGTPSENIDAFYRALSDYNNPG